MDKYILVYGSLRKGEYNYEYFKNGMEYVKTVEIPNYKLYSLGAYPGIKESNNNEDILICDLMKITDESCGEGVHRMEVGAGYSYKTINIDGIDATIYPYEGNVRDEDLVVSGDWSKYLKQEEVI